MTEEEYIKILNEQDMQAQAEKRHRLPTRGQKFVVWAEPMKLSQTLNRAA